jgi:hypothetical protein
MIQNPGKKWVIRDFAGPEGASLGLIHGVFETMEKKGYIEWAKKGPGSYAILSNRESLIEEWAKYYQFEWNLVDTYYSPEKNILEKINENMEKDRYAFTLHTGANFITSYLHIDQVFLYFDAPDWGNRLLEIRQRLELKELVQGGNVHFIRPFYKRSVFFNCQDIDGYPVVSHLQLYLDLYNFQPRGRDHAQQLKYVLAERGKILD